MNNITSKKKKSIVFTAGFTLVELLVAISILAIAILATFTAVSIIVSFTLNIFIYITYNVYKKIR